MSHFWGGMLRMCKLIDGQSETSMTGSWHNWATCDARISARPLALRGLGLRGEPSFVCVLSTVYCFEEDATS